MKQFSVSGRALNPDEPVGSVLAEGARMKGPPARGAGEDINSRVRSNYESLTTSEKKVADYIIKGGGNMINTLSIAGLASEAVVSNATVVRFSKRLGFVGFVDFKRALFADLLETRAHDAYGPYPEVESGDDLHGVISKLASLMQVAIYDTFANLDMEVFERAAHVIARARRVKLFAHGGSGHIALNAVNKFLLLGTDCVAYTERLTHEIAAGYLDAEDVAIALSHTGVAVSVENAVRLARDRGAATIAISNNDQSPIAKRAQLHLLTVVPSARVGSEAGVTRVTQVAMLDSLAVASAHVRHGVHSRSVKGGEM
jgi:DNA-binding MurR/RpiR family transcriptional regulator